MQVFNQGDLQAWSHDPLVHKQLGESGKQHELKWIISLIKHDMQLRIKWKQFNYMEKAT
jgi:hypothetical protein